MQYANFQPNIINRPQYSCYFRKEPNTYILKEIRDILAAHKLAKVSGLRSALATVVHVEGSSYRRPGARMLVTEDGKLTGAISGGCLEGDALRKALLAINQGENKLVSYDSTDEDDARFGIQLGCNGIVHVLFEPLKDSYEFTPIHLLQELLDDREDAVLATLFSFTNAFQPGTVALQQAGRLRVLNSIRYDESLQQDTRSAFDNKQSVNINHSQDGLDYQVLFEFLQPPLEVIIAGAGNDVQPLVEMCDILGWSTLVVDGRSTHATPSRFPKAVRVMVRKAENILDDIETHQRQVFLLMSHNYNYDLNVLKQILDKKLLYIGVLGPKRKLERMLGEIYPDKTSVAEQFSNLHGPTGLDIGAETAEQIALSIVAEIQAAATKRGGSPLKEKPSHIHHRLPNETLNG